MRTHIIAALTLGLTLCFIACHDVHDEAQLSANITGDITYGEETFEMRGGLIDDDVERISRNCETLGFKIPDLAIPGVRYVDYLFFQ